MREQFQFTHPGKGATRGSIFSAHSVTVSIHAPWEGCDWDKERMIILRHTFQFTHPGKGATKYQCRGRASSSRFNSRTLGRVRHLLRGEDALVSLVSIHAPWEGCDTTKRRVRRRTRVSIHAPWEGCDARTLHPRQLLRGVSIHAPWEGCDRSSGRYHCPSNSFQFTHPGKGATLSPAPCRARCSRFNSRTLGRVRQQQT